MKNKIIFIGFVVILSFSVSIGSMFLYQKFTADKNGKYEIGEKCAEHCRLAEIINPNDKQTKAIAQIEQPFKEKKNKLAIKLAQIRKEIAVELRKDNSDTVIINAKLAELNAVQADLNCGTVENIIKLKNVLNAEQRNNFCAYVCEELSK